MRAIKHCARGAVVLAMVLLLSGCSLYQKSQDGWEILESKITGGEQGEPSEAEAPDTEEPETDALDEPADPVEPDEPTEPDEPEDAEGDGIPGTYTVPDGWVEAEEASTSDKIFYTREGETQDVSPDNISVNVDSNSYSLEEYQQFGDAILQQLSMQAKFLNAKSLNSSGSNTEQGYILFTFTLEGSSGTLTRQYYIVREYGYCLFHATSFSGTEEVFDVAQSMVDSFVWNEDSAPAAE